MINEIIFKIEYYISKIQIAINNLFTKYHKPFYKTDDLVKCVIGSTVIAYRIKSIDKSKYGYAYNLKGEGIVINGEVSNLQVSERDAYTFRSYSPFCHWFDKDKHRLIIKC